jgi:lysophospholipase L1-like esterase
MKYFLVFFITFFLVAFNFPGVNKITIFLAGDSTLSIKEPKAYPETGWGMPFLHFWNKDVTVVNKAKNGRSTRTFIEEGLWSSIIEEMKSGDYVLIQFGHNDESKEKTDRYTTPEQFKANLEKFVKEAISKGGKPILLSPVSRRKFDADGNALETHAEYAPFVKEMALKLQVPFIDLNAKSRELYQRMGYENSKLLFLQLLPGEHPNYPEGKNDNTHFNELGARLIAQLVLQEMKNCKLDICDYVIAPVKK